MAKKPQIKDDKLFLLSVPQDIRDGLEQLVKLGDFPTVGAAVEKLLREGIRKRLPADRPPCT